MSKPKVIIGILLIIAIITSAFMFIRFRNSVKISASDMEDIYYPVTSYRQDNNKWSEDTLGNSEFTMKTSGCLTSCIATALSYNSDEVTPGELNKIFSENNVYDNEGNLLWAQLGNIGHSADVISTISEEAINNYLKNGAFPIVRVRVNGVGNFHYVLIVGIENGEYICMDPLKDQLTGLSDYFNRVYAIRVVY